MDKSTQPELKPEQKAEMKPTHRYFCDACTGVAFTIAEGAEVTSIPKNCRMCGAPVGAIKKENFIKL